MVLIGSCLKLLDEQTIIVTVALLHEKKQKIVNNIQ